MPPPVQRLDHWTLVTSDVERSKRFYTGVLGAELLTEGFPSSVKLAGLVIDLFQASKEQEQPQPATGSSFQHHAYVIRPEDFDPWVEHLRASQVPARLTSHGTHRMSMYFDDPDGYHLEFTVLFDDPEVGRRELEKRGIRVR